jgi:hypothetical protein
MGTHWRDCVVTLIDLVGTKAQATAAIASTQMRKLHRTLMDQAQTNRYSFAHAYAYNDAVLLLSYVDGKAASYRTAMRDADALKKEIDQIRNSYAIAVKGQAFPPVSNVITGGRVTVIEASSWAMANCFEIEKQLGHLKQPWYVDERIASKITTDRASKKHEVSMYPSGGTRSIHVYDGYLWTASAD